MAYLKKRIPEGSHIYGSKVKNSLVQAWEFLLYGERGIRTPGPALAGQLFSRQPRSTAPAFLQRAKLIFVIDLHAEIRILVF